MFGDVILSAVVRILFGYVQVILLRPDGFCIIKVCYNFCVTFMYYGIVVGYPIFTTVFGYKVECISLFYYIFVV